MSLLLLFQSEPNGASGSLDLAASVTTSSTTSGSLSLAGSAASSSTTSGSLSLAAAATTSTGATGALTLNANGTWSTGAVGTLAVAAQTTSQASDGATGSLSLGGSGTTSTGATGALSLGASANPKAAPTTSGALSLGATANPPTSTGATASLTLGGSVQAGAAVAGSQVSYSNSFEGGTNGTTITTANSGGVSGDAFDSTAIGTGSTLTYDTSKAAHGTTSALATTNGSASAAAAFVKFLPSASSRIATHLYINLNTLPATTTPMVVFSPRSGTTISVRVAVTQTGTVQLRDPSNTVMWTSTATVSPGTWYRCEFQSVLNGDTTGNASVQLFTLDSLTALDAASNVAMTGLPTTYDRIYAGIAIGSAAVFSVNVDDFALKPDASPIGPYGAGYLAGSLTLGGGATASFTATGTLDVSASPTAQANTQSTGALTLAATGTGSATAAASASLSLAASGAWTVGASGSLTLASNATPRAAASATGALALSGSLVGSQTATGALALAATGTSGTSATASGSIALAGSGAWNTQTTAAITLACTPTAAGTASTTGALTLSGSATPSRTATGAISLDGSGASGPLSSTASAALTVAATATARAPGSATATVSLAAASTGRAPDSGTIGLTLGATATARAAATCQGALSVNATGSGSMATGASASVQLAATTDVRKRGAGAATFELFGVAGRVPSAATAILTLVTALQATSSGTPPIAEVDDLPNLSASFVFGGAVVDLLEAIGPAPASEHVVNTLNLLSKDEHSDSFYAPAAKLRRNSNGSVTYSCERWVRLRFSPPFGAVSNVRFWMPNYQPSTGWTVQWGTADTYRQPSRDRSSLATAAVPTADPGAGNVGLDLAMGDTTRYSDWIVIQAQWTGSSTGAIQADPLDFAFDWTES